MINFILADPTAAAVSGESAMHVAVRHCRFEAVQLLLQYVEDQGGKAACKLLVNQRTKEGLTALHLAAEIRKEQAHYEKEDAQIMHALTDAGGDINIQSSTV
jgi:ankyrin repeat protein